MLQTIEAEIDMNGVIRLLEPPPQNLKPGRVLVTLLEAVAGPADEPQAEGNAVALLALLHQPEFVGRPSSSPQEMEARIAELRNSWE